MSKNTVSSIAALIQEREQAAYARGRADIEEELRTKVLGEPSRQKRGGRPKTRSSKKRALGKAKRANWWDTATEEQKKARVRKMLAGRGLTPKAER